jgi:hypothetical protein
MCTNAMKVRVVSHPQLSASVRSGSMIKYECHQTSLCGAFNTHVGRRAARRCATSIYPVLVTATADWPSERVCSLHMQGVWSQGSLGGILQRISYPGPDLRDKATPGVLPAIPRLQPGPGLIREHKREAHHPRHSMLSSQESPLHSNLGIVSSRMPPLPARSHSMQS